jgi:transcription elongation factor GreA
VSQDEDEQMSIQQEVLTREGYQRLEGELNYLSTVRRAQIARTLHEVLGDGDLLENAGLEDATNEQAFLEGQIRRLRRILGTASIIADEPMSRDSVGLGSTVTVVDLGADGAPETYRIVGSAEANPLEGTVSNESPLGRQLMGRRVGEHVTFDAPLGKMAFGIVGIR